MIHTDFMYIIIHYKLFKMKVWGLLSFIIPQPNLKLGILIFYKIFSCGLRVILNVMLRPKILSVIVKNHMGGKAVQVCLT